MIRNFKERRTLNPRINETIDYTARFMREHGVEPGELSEDEKSMLNKIAEAEVALTDAMDNYDPPKSEAAISLFYNFIEGLHDTYNELKFWGEYYADNRH